MKRKVVEEEDRVRVTRKTLQAVLEQCQRAIELICNSEGGIHNDDGEDEDDVDPQGEVSGVGLQRDQEVPVPENISEEGSSWDMVNENDLWENEDIGLDREDNVLVRQEDIVEGIACFMAAYLLSLKQTKDLTPNQLQEALSKTFSVKKKKGKLRKAWDRSRVIYNVASWGATAIGIYQNPVLLRAASKAFWVSCNVISKLL